MKRCATCKIVKPLDDFHLKRGSKDGRAYVCASCRNEYSRQYYLRNKDRYTGATQRDRKRWNALWSNYRLRKEDWLRILASQAGLCAVCEAVEPEVVDHDHACCETRPTCGKCVRALLCQRCNLLVGYIESDIERSRRALQYALTPRSHASGASISAANAD